MEELLRRRGTPLVGGRVPSADTLGYACARMPASGPRAVLSDVARRMLRNKSLRRHDDQVPWTAAVDGHELFKSLHRSCPQCQTRTVSHEGAQVTQYFHQAAVASLVDVEPPLCLDVDVLGPGEGEVVAARRVVTRLIEEFPWIKVFTLDALYLEAPILRQIVEAGRGAIVPLKCEQRELYQDVVRLFPQVKPRIAALDGRRLEIWDLRDLPGWPGMEGIPIRVVRTVLRGTRRRRVGGRWVEEPYVQDWMWVVVGCAVSLPAETIHRLGHGRWDIESRVFNEQDRFYALDHCFKHDVRAVENILLTLFLAVALSTLFFTRNVKDPLLRAISLAGRIRLLIERPPPPHVRSIWASCRPP